MFKAPLTKPLGVYDPNQGWRGTPSAENIIAAQRTPQAQLRSLQGSPSTEQQQQNTVDPNSSTSGMQAILGYTDPKEEERLRKASVANQRILAVGDALRHIGNIFHTVNYAPSQQFNNPVQEEYDRYQKGKAIRDAANARYYSYMQAKAAQDARIRQAEAQLQYNMEKDARDYELRKNESDARAKLNEARIQTQNMLTYLDELKAKGQITENERKEIVNKYLPQKEESIIARNNRSNTGRSGGGRGSGMSDYNVKETKTKVTNKDGSVTWISEKERRGQYGSQKSSSTKTTASNKSGFFNR